MTGVPIVGADRLLRILDQLTPADHAVLSRLEEHQYLQTSQLARFDFAARPTWLAGLRATHRALKKLRTLGLVVMMERTIGGVARGSTAAVWTITHTGLRVTAMHAGEGNNPRQARRRLKDPTLTFLRHQVAVADLRLALRDAVIAESATLRTLQLEPKCWRRYLGPMGAVTALKPDLYAEVDTANFDSRYFFEVDRSTESPGRIIAKCLQYQEYYRSGEEEKRGGILPLIIWVVPDDARRDQLRRHLTTDKGINPRLYRVLTIDDIPALVGEDDEVGKLPENNASAGGQP